jgi:hypothetical protein
MLAIDALGSKDLDKSIAVVHRFRSRRGGEEEEDEGERLELQVCI